ncbi:serine hydrolase domain-containing protein [Streptomyces sp. KL116D]|uniref:serine hydrolase domain-containing protein n=1 Tax=Streptomyces sp. KL116D TaxID=3045152 RepID=UPI003555C469
MSSQHPLLPRSAPSATGLPPQALDALLDRLETVSGACHSIMVVHRGQVVAEGWWAPYSADRLNLLYSLTKSFTSIAVGLAVGDGLLSLEDRVVDVLPEHVPADVSEQGRRITVHHLLSMTAGHPTDSLTEAWELEPRDLVKGFLRLPFAAPEGTRHEYDNSTTFLLARMVEKVTGRALPELMDERVFKPMGIDQAEWDRVASGASFGFQGLHLTTEAVAAFGQLLLQGGRWGGRQLVPRDWVDLATSRHIDSGWHQEGQPNTDFFCGYGYQFWMSRHGYHGHGAYGQQCVVVPSHDLVIAVTAEGESQEVFDALWECLLPGLESAVGTGTAAAAAETGHEADGDLDDAHVTERLRKLALPLVAGSSQPGRSVTAKLDASAEDSALPHGTAVAVDPVDGGWVVRFESVFDVEVGHGHWRESAPLGRPIVAAGAWQGELFVADLYVITTPHHVRLTIDGETGTAIWSTPPLTGPDLRLHVRSPLMTRPDVS